MIIDRNLQQPLHEFHHPLLVVGGAKVSTFAGKGQKIFKIT